MQAHQEWQILRRVIENQVQKLPQQPCSDIEEIAVPLVDDGVFTSTSVFEEICSERCKETASSSVRILK
jgi:hypothetical protein